MINYKMAVTINDEKKEGYPVLRLNELDNGFVGIPQKYCNTLSVDEFDKLKFRNINISKLSRTEVCLITFYRIFINLITTIFAIHI